MTAKENATLVAAREETALDMTRAEAWILKLSKLSPLEYERRREAEAKALGVRVGFLDRMVKAAGYLESNDGGGDPFEETEPWEECVDGAALLDAIQATILRFCVVPDYTATLMAGWILHAWSHDAFDISPVLAFVSPEKRCGKTTAMSVVGALTPKSMHAVNISTAVLFRVIEKYQPTVLIDEADTFLEANVEMRGALNGGHNRQSAFVWRSVGDQHEPHRFRVWSPKCIALIGKLPDTLEDRSLVVHLRRKQVGELVERFRADRVGELEHLRRKAARWSADNASRLSRMDPIIPASLNDRAQDNARALCAIADLVGGRWPTVVRSALVGAAEQAEDEPQSAGVLLLRDIAEIFERTSASRIGSEQLCDTLCALGESPWADWRHGGAISTRGIARLLKPFDIGPRRDRDQRYYSRADFADAFSRYLTDSPERSSASVTSVTTGPIVMKNNN